MSRFLPGELEASMCAGKIAYETGVLAGKAKDGMSRKRKAGSTIYRCHFCHKWHVGRNNREVEVRSKAARNKPPKIPGWVGAPR